MRMESGSKQGGEEEDGDVAMGKEGDEEDKDEVEDEDTDEGEDDNMEEDEESDIRTKLFLDDATAMPIATALGLTPTDNTPKSASFAVGTSFTQKKLSRAKNPVNPYLKAVATSNTATQAKIQSHTFHTYIRVQINIRGEDNTPAAIIRVLGAFLTCLQTKDPLACFT